MNITYRTPNAADIPALAKLAKKTLIDKFGHLYSNENLQYHLNKTCSETFFKDALKKDKMLIACDGNNIVGYAKWGGLSLPVEEPIEPCGEIHRLYVDSNCQGQGIGRELMDLMMDDLKDKASIYLSVFSDNDGAQRFYQRYDFSKYGEYEYMVGTHADHEFIYYRKQ